MSNEKKHPIKLGKYILRAGEPKNSHYSKNEENEKPKLGKKSYDEYFRPDLRIDGLRVTLVSSTGSVLYDSKESYSLNYNTLPEIMRAIQTREFGRATRPSASNGVFHNYLAKTYWSTQYPNYHITVRISLPETDYY